MTDRAAKLGRKQQAAILALLSQRSVEEAARVAEIAPRTLYRWRKDPEFGAAYREAKRLAFSQSTARLHQMGSAAVTTLGKAMVDPSTPPATRVRAAHSILEHIAKAMELEDIEARLAELERSAEKKVRSIRKVARHVYSLAEVAGFLACVGARLDTTKPHAEEFA